MALRNSNNEYFRIVLNDNEPLTNVEGFSILSYKNKTVRLDPDSDPYTVPKVVPEDTRGLVLFLCQNDFDLSGISDPVDQVKSCLYKFLKTLDKFKDMVDC